MTFKLADWDGMDMWCGWDKRGYIRKCYTQVEGKRSRGRPGIIWIDHIRKYIEMWRRKWKEIQ